MAQKTASIDLGPIGLDVELRIGEIQSTLDQLTGAVESAGGQLSDTVAGAVEKLRHAGIQQLRQTRECCERGDASCCESDEMGLYESVVGQLQAAAAKGVDAARNLLGDLGEKVPSSGHSGAGRSGESSATH